MSEIEQAPITRADIDVEEKSKTPGAHGEHDKSGQASTGASKVRKGPEEIAPSEDVDDA